MWVTRFIHPPREEFDASACRIPMDVWTALPARFNRPFRLGSPRRKQVATAVEFIEKSENSGGVNTP